MCDDNSQIVFSFFDCSSALVRIETSPFLQRLTLQTEIEPTNWSSGTRLLRHPRNEKRMYVWLTMTQSFTEEKRGLDFSPRSGEATSGEK